MENRDYLEAILQEERDLVINYANLLNEASSNYIYKEYLKQFEKITVMTRRLLAISYSKGWLILEKENKQKLNQNILNLSKEIKKND